VNTGHSSNYLILVPASIRDQAQSVLMLLDVTCGREDVLQDDKLDSCDWNSRLLLFNYYYSMPDN